MYISIILFGLFLLQGLTTFLRGYCFGIAGERVVMNLRKQLFSSIIKQGITKLMV
jgi:ABC-type multidrug transport system fused ATPase/permease subunit